MWTKFYTCRVRDPGLAEFWFTKLMFFYYLKKNLLHMLQGKARERSGFRKRITVSLFANCSSDKIATIGNLFVRKLCKNY